MVDMSSPGPQHITCSPEQGVFWLQNSMLSISQPLSVGLWVPRDGLGETVHSGSVLGDYPNASSLKL